MKRARKSQARQPAKVSGKAAGAAVRQQVSAGGVAYRGTGAQVEIALISVAAPAGPRWQLPKGLVDPGETPQVAAIREVREEAGITAELVAPIETIDYWYVASEAGQSVRFHKFVHFFLLAYVSGDVSQHDHEVLEAAWCPLDEALQRLAFPGERRVVELARELIAARKNK
jgi:8-oxo-dGTP pyrophosphatase MutT (NUDIX family)